jgi:hypothetical protein
MIVNYSLQVAQEKQQKTNFYDVGNSGIGNLTLQEVTGGVYNVGTTLANFLQNANAATSPNMGYNADHTAVVLNQGIISESYPEFILVMRCFSTRMLGKVTPAYSGMRSLHKMGCGVHLGAAQPPISLHG